MKKVVLKSSSSPSIPASANPEPVVRILKIGTCPSISGKSELTYHVGTTAEGDVQLRVFANSGGGFFSPEWVSLAAIQQALEKRSADKPITSFLFRTLFRGKSVNSTGFLMAALKHEALVRPKEGKQRCYEPNDPSAFLAKARSLIESSVDLKAGDPIKPAAASKSSNAKPKQKAA